MTRDELLREAEMKLIGNLILHRSVYLDLRYSLLSTDFLDPAYRAAYPILDDMYLNQEGPIVVTELCSRVQKKVGAGKGSAMKILTAVDEAVSTASVPWALEKVLDASKRRRLHKAVEQISKRIDSVENPDDLFSELLSTAAGGRREVGNVLNGEAMASEFEATMEERRKTQDPIKGFRTGFRILDTHLGGLMPGRLGLLSGGYGEGKTALAINWLTNIGVEREIPALFVSLEMDQTDVEDRIVAILSGTPIRQLGTGVLTPDRYDHLQRLRNSPLLITDNHPRTIVDVCFLIEKHVHADGVKLVVLDYIGELLRDHLKYRKEERDERFSRWVKMLRDQAKKLNFHCLILAQVNYEGALAESKKMAAHADYYLHLAHDKHGVQFLEMRKNRFGPRNYLYRVQYDKQVQKMTEDGILEPEKKEGKP